MENWSPLVDIWEDYSEKLDEVKEADLAEDKVWPRDLFMGDMEKESVKEFLTERIEEMVNEAQRQQGVNLHWIGGYLFKSLVTGMLWERERVGR